MIRTLTINNIALVEHVTVEFHSGLTVLSGETGAGKSIIVDAVALILGGRADRDLIRTGCDRASVEAEFEADSASGLKDLMEHEQIDWNGHSLLLSRELSQAGRNVCRINGIIVSAAVLKETASSLLNLHGQSEHQFLADEDKHLTYLDLMGDEDHKNLLEHTRIAYQNFIVNHRAYAKLVRMNEGRERRIDYLGHELEELHHAGIRPGEENRLNEESRRLHKASRIREKLDHAAAMIGNGDEGGDALHGLQTAARELNSLADEDPEFSEIARRCENISYEIEDVIYALNGLNSRYDFDAQALEQAENRLDSIRRITRKYGPSEEDVLKNLEEMETEYSTLLDLDEKLRETGADHKKLLAVYRSRAKELTASRKRIAAVFRQKMMHELKDLGMENTVIEAVFSDTPGDKPLMPSPLGDDRICFMISPNPGEPLKPMSKTASGGELSRLMLAIKTIESGRSGSQTMIFDEIDTGISGRTAQAVAEKMMMISSHQQVLCISHLPQIAAAADHNLLVHKSVRNGRTLTEVNELSGENRIDEIARMISGAEGITKEAKYYAGQMIEASARKKGDSRAFQSSGTEKACQQPIQNI